MQINFNGKTYNDIDEMPANERQAYEQILQIFTDANGNGIPDFLEGDIARNVITAFTNVVHYDGKTYNSLGELPADARQKVHDAFAKLNQYGVVSAGEAKPAQPFEPAFQPSKPLLQQEPAIQESSSRNWMLIVGFLAVLLLCAVAFAFVMFLR
jgi:hypothetical protein